MAVDDGDAGRHAAGGEEVRRPAEALLVLGDEPVVHRVLGDLVVVVGGAFHAREGLVGLQRGEDVAAGGELDAEAVGLHGVDLGERIAAAGPDHPDDLAALLVLQRVEEALADGGEVRRVLRHVFLVDELGAGARRAPP